MNKEEVTLTNLQKFLALTAVTVLMIVGFVILNLVSSDNSDRSGPNNASFNCDTIRDPTACPEPDYEQTVEESKKYPDATQYDHSDDCGGYSCEKLRQEAMQEEQDYQTN